MANFEAHFPCICDCRIMSKSLVFRGFTSSSLNKDRKNSEF